MNIRMKSNIAVSDNGFVFDPSTGNSYSVNPIGVQIMHWMRQVSSEEELKEHLLNQYSTDSKTIEKDLYDFFNMLLNLELAERLWNRT